MTPQRPLKLGMIGCGAMAATMIEALIAEQVAFDELTVLVRQSSTQAEIDGWGLNARSVTTIDALIARSPDIIVECASQAALHAYGCAVLAAGIDLIVASAGALADEALHHAMLAAARSGDARLVIAPGAVGGIDVLAAARLSTLQDVTYISRKPPSAWLVTPAETLVNLAGLQEAHMFYDGTARQAARDYPRNANVAATVALAVTSFDNTRVQMIADPAVTANIHEIAFTSGCATVTIRLEGIASSRNPKTSLTAGYSLARLVLQHIGYQVI